VWWFLGQLAFLEALQESIHNILDYVLFIIFLRELCVFERVVLEQYHLLAFSTLPAFLASWALSLPFVACLLFLEISNLPLDRDFVFHVDGSVSVGDPEVLYQLVVNQLAGEVQKLHTTIFWLLGHRH